jgi:hypothetical protein
MDDVELMRSDVFTERDRALRHVTAMTVDVESRHLEIDVLSLHLVHVASAIRR